MSLKSLSIATFALFITALFVFFNQNKRGTDLVAGSDFIKGLDVSKINKIVLSFPDEKKITFARDGGKFRLEDHKGYPSDNKKVNDLIFKIAGLQVKDKIAEGVDKDDLAKYELDEKKRKYLIEIFDNDEKKTVSFSVGKSPKGRGNYILKNSQKTVYLSQNNLWINSSYKDFVNQVLLDVKKDDIEGIELKTDKNLKLTKQDKEFKVENLEEKQFTPKKVENYFANFSSLRFSDYYKHSDGEVKDLKFSKNVKVRLNNKLIYSLDFAKKKDDYFVKLNALLNEIPGQVVVHQDDGKEKLKNIEDMVKAQGTAQQFNFEKGGWVYKIDKAVYEKLVKMSSDFS